MAKTDSEQRTARAERRAKHLIVISEDALVREDLPTLKTLPHFGRIWDRAARVDTMRSVYPSVTYPCHASMVTGVYPHRHGIVNNEQSIVGEASSEWVHFRRDIKVPTVLDLAKSRGLSTASVFWPVSGGDPSVDWLIDEYWPRGEHESFRDCLRNSGSSEEVLKKIVDPRLHMVVPKSDWRWHPNIDRFISACACAIVREFRPNLLLIHPANIDAYRHETGVFSERVTHGLYEIDEWLGDLIRAAQDAGIYEDTNFMVVSDHGQVNIVRAVAVNAVLAEHGLIETAADGAFVGYTAFAKAAGLSSQVFLRDPSDSAAYDRTYALLQKLCDDGVYGIGRVYTAEEALREEGLAGDFSFVLESDGYSAFSNNWTRPVVRPLDITDYKFGHATHGYQPDKGPQPTLLAFGPDFEPGALVERGSIVDIAPTVAEILGLGAMDGIDGKAIKGLFKSV